MESSWIHTLITAGLLFLLGGGTQHLNPVVLYVHEGGSVEVECEEREEGGATWTRGGREIQNGTHYTIYPGGVLVIVNITADITGHSQPYRCANSSSVTIIIIVEQTVTMATPPENPSYDRTQAIVIASILGTCAFSVISVLLVCGLLYCVCKKDFDPDLELDAVEYNIEEEYEARLDPQAIARLEPGVRSKIDLSFLDRIADTQPQMLAEFTQCLQDRGKIAETDISLASSLGLACHSPTDRPTSCQSIVSKPRSVTDTVPDAPTSPSATPRSCTPQPPGPGHCSTKPFCRANTISDFNHLAPSIEVVEGGADSPIQGLVRFLKRTPVAPEWSRTRSRSMDTIQ